MQHDKKKDFSRRNWDRRKCWKICMPEKHCDL